MKKSNNTRIFERISISNFIQDTLAVQVLNIYKKTRYNNVCILLDENTQRQFD